MLLQINNLYKNFLGVCALNNVSLALDKGSVVAFVGDNGAGKSTLMKCITGALSSDRGEILLDGEVLVDNSPSKSRGAGIEMIYQTLSLCQQQDVVTNIYLGREQQKGMLLDRKSMLSQGESIFNELEIAIPLRSIVGSLSGGQQQLVAIARAMITEPKLLIMDEPTASLGVKEVDRVLKLITTLKEKGVAVAMVTHRLADIFEVADRIVVMSHGEIKHDLLPKDTDIKDLTLRIIG